MADDHCTLLTFAGSAAVPRQLHDALQRSSPHARTAPCGRGAARRRRLALHRASRSAGPVVAARPPGAAHSRLRPGRHLDRVPVFVIVWTHTVGALWQLPAALSRSTPAGGRRKKNVALPRRNKLSVPRS